MGSLFSVREMRPWCTTKAIMQVKMMVNPLFVRSPTDIRDLYTKEENRWLWRTTWDSMESLIIPSWVDVMIALSRRRTETGFWVGRILAMGQSIMTYVPVDTESRKAEWGCLRGGVSNGVVL